MSRKLILAACGLIVLGGQFAWGKTVSCTMMSLERTVELRYQNPGEAVPCEIGYSKQSEGFDDQVLWRAEHEAGYCEARFDEFVDRLRGFGWSCEEVDSDASSAASDDIAPPDAADDEPGTEAIEPAEPTDADAPEAPASE